MTDPFDLALSVVLKHEGGFVDDSDDDGGPTNYGLTLHDWESYFGKAGTAQDIKGLTTGQASAIYHKLFWVPIGLDKVSSPVLAAVLFDQAVLSGATTVGKRLQEILGLTVDGLWTDELFMKLNERDGKVLGGQFLTAAVGRYIEIVRARPIQMKFFGGWMHRLCALYELLLAGDP